MARTVIEHMGDNVDEFDNLDCVMAGHDEETTYEDDDVWQGTCRRCGAEMFEDKT